MILLPVEIVYSPYCSSAAVSLWACSVGSRGRIAEPPANLRMTVRQPYNLCSGVVTVSKVRSAPIGT